MNTKLDTCGSASDGLRPATTARNTPYPPFGEASPSADEIRNTKNGFVLLLVLFGIVILMALIIGTAMTSYGSRIQAVQTKSQTEAMLAAEAGYEQAIFWMSQRTDLLGDLQAGGGQGTINFATGSCSYIIGFHGFIGARPVFRVTSTGICGRPSFTRIVDVDIVQETSGWAMGTCRIPSGPSSTDPVYFGNGEIIDMPLHINQANDNPDVADIFIDTSNGSPTFLRKVEMGESRKISATGSSGNDKKIIDSSGHQIGTYASVMPLFKNGIDFDQPGIRITDEAAVQSKVNRFRDSTATAYQFTPTAIAPNGGSLSSPKCSAVQLEFFVQGGIGKVRIDPNCTVQLHSAGPSDYNIVSGSNPISFHQYSIYAYHFKKTTDPCTIVPITATYVTQTIGGYTSDPGGQIYVNGNVIIGGDVNPGGNPDQVVKGKITVVATGNIWIADSIKVDDNGGLQRDVNGMPKADNPNSNPNVLGLIAQGVIKVVDPGLAPATPTPPTGYIYRPIGILKSGNRYLPDPTVVEAAITVGGGGWGAENVVYPSGGRRVYSSPQDYLIVHGSITEVIRGVVGHLNNDGYVKQYYIDTRLMSGILPADIWFSGKYIPAPAGWHDHSPNN
jgi:hypothetical protein